MSDDLIVVVEGLPSAEVQADFIADQLERTVTEVGDLLVIMSHLLETNPEVRVHISARLSALLDTGDESPRVRPMQRRRRRH
jgi:hypothetical protein